LVKEEGREVRVIDGRSRRRGDAKEIEGERDRKRRGKRNRRRKRKKKTQRMEDSQQKVCKKME
jgi:hypothetical protein